MGKAIAEVEATRRWEFLEAVRDGTGDAAVEVGWSPAELRKALSDPEFRDLVDVARERTLEDIEKVVFDKAHAGMRWACELVLYNKGKHRGWVPPTHKVDISQHTVAEQRVVLVAVDAIKELMAQQTDPAALQRFAGVIDAEAS
jgi:hypothetical protein